MTQQHFTPADRQRIARQWRASGIPQQDFAQQHGIAPRTLRQWCQRYAPPGTPPDAVVALLTDFIERAQALLASVQSPPSAVPPARAAASPPEPQPPACPSPLAAPQPPVAPKKKALFDWSSDDDYPTDA